LSDLSPSSKEDALEAKSHVMKTLAEDDNVAGVGVRAGSNGGFYVRVRLTEPRPYDLLLHEYKGVPIHYRVGGTEADDEFDSRARSAAGDNPDDGLYGAWCGLRDWLSSDRRVAGIRRSGSSQPPLLTVFMKQNDRSGIPEEFDGYTVRIVTPADARVDPSPL
jgi:hypothetical protein